jgi:hypothetical protein
VVGSEAEAEVVLRLQDTVKMLPKMDMKRELGKQIS